MAKQMRNFSLAKEEYPTSPAVRAFGRKFRFLHLRRNGPTSVALKLAFEALRGLAGSRSGSCHPLQDRMPKNAETCQISALETLQGAPRGPASTANSPMRMLLGYVSSRRRLTTILKMMVILQSGELHCGGARRMREAVVLHE